MSGKVFFSVSMSLDGFIAPQTSDELTGEQWMALQRWVFPQRFFARTSVSATTAKRAVTTTSFGRPSNEPVQV